MLVLVVLLLCRMKGVGGLEYWMYSAVVLVFVVPILSHAIKQITGEHRSPDAHVASSIRLGAKYGSKLTCVPLIFLQQGPWSARGESSCRTDYRVCSLCAARFRSTLGTLCCHVWDGPGESGPS